jgi:hypothetical protein
VNICQLGEPFFSLTSQMRGIKKSTIPSPAEKGNGLGKCGEQGDDRKKPKTSIDRKCISLYIGEGNLRAVHDCVGADFGMCMLRHGSHMYIAPRHIYAPISTFTIPDMLSKSTC